MMGKNDDRRSPKEYEYETLMCMRDIALLCSELMETRGMSVDHIGRVLSVLEDEIKVCDAEISE